MEKEHSKKPKDVVNGLIDERSKGKISKAVAKTIVNALLVDSNSSKAEILAAIDRHCQEAAAPAKNE